MSSEWRVTKIEEIAAPFSTALATGPFGSAISSKYFVDSGVPVIRGANLSADASTRLIDADLAFVSQEKASEFQRSVATRGDLVFTCWGTINQVGLIDARSKFESYIVSNKQMKLTVDPVKADHRFIYYVFSGPVKQSEILDNGIGSSVPGFNLGQLRRHEVLLPPLEEQKRIADFLETLDDRIVLLRETNVTLEAVAQALFKSWFVDFDPVRAKAEGRQPEGMDAATAALFPNSFEESELGLVPRGWKAEIAEQWLSALETGRRPKGGVSGILDGVPSIGAESIVRIGEFDYSKTKYVSAEFFEKMKAGALQSHDVLLYKDGGKPGVFLPRVSMFGEGFPFRVCGINEHVFRVRLKYPFSQTFLYYWLWSDSVMHELKHRGGKAAIPGINQSDVKELKLLVPSEQTLNRFDEITKPLISKIFENSKKAQVLTQLRDSLLPRLISGQLRLLEAEALAAGDT
ncbi:restriction endonuclease subunit S [Pseudomonas aeruginosa]|nr:restriction endonuclease subunit S [Pseudomonas aeruginosa]